MAGKAKASGQQFLFALLTAVLARAADNSGSEFIGGEISAATNPAIVLSSW